MQIPSLRLLVSDLQTNIRASELGLSPTPYATFREGFSRFCCSYFKAMYTEVLRNTDWLSVKAFDEVGIVKLVDGSLFPTLKSMDWAEYKKNRRAIRLHLSWDLNTQIPTDFIAQKANSSERNFLRSIVKTGITYIADRGYFSFKLAESIHQAEAFFILRMKKNILYTVTKKQAITSQKTMPQCFKQLNDEQIQFDNDHSGITYRLIRFRVLQSQFMICTNRLDLTTLQVIMLYAYRWQVELMFKFLKRSLHGIHLLNHSENGVNIQFYILMMTVLLKLRLKQICLLKTEAALQSKSFVEKQKQKNIRLEDLNIYSGNRLETWIRSINQTFYTYWKIGAHWLWHLKNVITQVFDDHVINTLANT